MSRIPNTSKHVRRGMAPLEMVMCLPILVFIFALIIYVGLFVIGQAQCTAQARREAWHKGRREARSQAYDFQGAAGRVEATVDLDVQLAPRLFGGFPDPRARHVVLGDAWSARSDGPSAEDRQRFQELNDHWNHRLQGRLVSLAGVNEANQATSALQSLPADLSNLDSAVYDMIQSQFGGFLGKLTGFRDQISSLNAQAEGLIAEKGREQEMLHDQLVQQFQQSALDNVKKTIEDKTGIKIDSIDDLDSAKELIQKHLGGTPAADDLQKSLEDFKKGKVSLPKVDIPKVSLPSFP